MGNGGKKKAKKKASSVKKAPPHAKASAVSQKSPKAGLERRIIMLYAGNKEAVFDSELLIDGLGADQKVINLALGRLASKGKLIKANGGYMLGAENLQDIRKAKAS